MNQHVAIETLSASSRPQADLVILHGWAMHSGVMRELADSLSTRFRVHLLDLPGHGHNQFMGNELNLQAMSQQVHDIAVQRITSPAIWLGWSLGGLVALDIASRFPGSVSKLILLSSNPAFVKKADWPYAVDATVFEQFASQLLAEREMTIKRFLALQVLGSEDSRGQLKRLNQALDSRPMAQQQALVHGLDILQQQDLRNIFTTLEQPVLLVAGEQDSLVPVSAMQALMNTRPGVSMHTVRKAGHAPFISHLQETVSAIDEFCHD